jgi:hypothetical protein
MKCLFIGEGSSRHLRKSRVFSSLIVLIIAARFLAAQPALENGRKQASGNTITYITGPWGTRVKAVQRGPLGPEVPLPSAITIRSSRCASISESC